MLTNSNAGGCWVGAYVREDTNLRQLMAIINVSPDRDGHACWTLAVPAGSFDLEACRWSFDFRFKRLFDVKDKGAPASFSLDSLRFKWTAPTFSQISWIGNSWWKAEQLLSPLNAMSVLWWFSVVHWGTHSIRHYSLRGDGKIEVSICWSG